MPLAAIDFVRPGALWALLAVPPFLFLMLTGRSCAGWRGGGVAVMRTLIVALLILAVARPRTFDRVEKVVVMFVLDVSRSVPTEPRGRALQQVESWFDRMPEGDRAGLVIFARRPALEIPLRGVRGRDDDAGMSARLQNLESRFELADSDLEFALGFAQGLFPDDAGRRIVLISDGNQTVGDLTGAARALQADGVRLDVLPIRYRHEQEVIVEGLRAPPVGRLGEPLQLRAVVSAQAPTTAEVQLAEAGSPMGDPMTVRLDRGTNVLRFSPTPAQSGALQYEVRVRAEGDGNPANNVGRAGVLVGGTPQVGVVSDAGRDERLADALEAAGINVRRMRPSELPKHPARFVGLDTIVLDDVPAFRLDEEQRLALKDAVKELGCGLVTVGGPNSFGPGGYRGTPIADVLPVDLDTTNRKALPKGALAIVLHSVEFDSGNTWAVAICRSALKGLNADDEAGIVYYDYRDGERWLFDIAPLGDKKRQFALIDKVQVGDMVSFHNCFKLAQASLAKSDAAVKHIVVISDGDPQVPTPGLMLALRGMLVTTSTICIAPHTPMDVKAMRELARAGGGRFYQLDPHSELHRLPRLMLKEAATLRRASVKETPFTPITLLPSSPLLRGVDAWPKLGGYVITSMRAGAETILLADEKERDPLLAAWHIGLGRSVAFTSDATSRWAREWLGWERFGPFWAQVVRSCAPSFDRSPFPVTVTSHGLELEVAMAARGPAGVPVTSLDVAGKLLSEGHDPVPFESVQSEAGIYRARVPVAEPGHYMVSLSFEHDGKPATAVAATSVDFAPEYRSLASNPELLLHAAGLTGGRELGPDDDPFARDLPDARGRVELWRALAFLAAGLLVLEVATRRLDLGLGRWMSHARERARDRRTERTESRAADAAPQTPAPAYTPPLDPKETRREEKKPSSAPTPTVSREETLEQLKKAKKRADRRREWR